MEFNKLGTFLSQATLADVVYGVEWLCICVSEFLIMGAGTWGNKGD